MSDVLVVFGSASDLDGCKRLFERLKAAGVGFELRICSAHRAPKLLEEIVSKTKAKVIIAAAGLSAALAGAIASHTIKPVIGLPLDSDYSGLDALLSIAQMPQGIPVLAAGIGNCDAAADAAIKIISGKKEVLFCAAGSAAEDAVAKAKKTLEEFGAGWGEATGSDSSSKNSNSIYLNFIGLHGGKAAGAEAKSGNSLVINCPALKGSKAVDALVFAEASKQGIWVGLNRGENAALAAIEVLNAATGAYSKKLSAHREEMRKKIAEANAAAAKG